MFLSPRRSKYHAASIEPTTAFGYVVSGTTSKIPVHHVPLTSYESTTSSDRLASAEFTQSLSFFLCFPVINHGSISIWFWVRKLSSMHD